MSFLRNLLSFVSGAGHRQQGVQSGTPPYDDSGTTIFLSNNIEVTKSIIPLINATSDLGSPSFRFRNVNTVSGFSTVWSSSEKIITPKIDLGIDSEGNPREITADNSIITNDTITGGDY